jgi:CBS domain-containing protein
MPTLTKPPRKQHDYLPSSDPLDVEVRDAMTPGVVTITETASLHQANRALVAHGVHSILVIGRNNGKPIGWVTARGLLGRITHDNSLRCVGEAVTHPPASIQPSATVREALTALGQPGITQLLVATRPGVLPEGVLSDLDVIAVAGS